MNRIIREKSTYKQWRKFIHSVQLGDILNTVYYDVLGKSYYAFYIITNKKSKYCRHPLSGIRLWTSTNKPSGMFLNIDTAYPDELIIITKKEMENLV